MNKIFEQSIARVKSKLDHPLFPNFKKKQTKTFFSSEKIKSSDIAEFAYELSSLIKIGIPMTKSLDTIMKSHEKKSMQEMIHHLKSSVESGKTLAQSLEYYPKHIDHLLINLISVGEESGTLEKQLTYAATYKEKIEQLKNKLKKAMFYPISVIIFTSLIIIGILIFIIPQFQDLFANFDATLPTLTRHMISFSSLFKKHFILMLISIITFSMFFYLLKKYSILFNRQLQVVLLKMPITKDIISNTFIARICTLLAITYEAGLPLPKAVKMISESTSHQLYSEALMEVQANLHAGESIQSAIASSDLFPHKMLQMLQIGEESGTLPIVLKKLADHYQTHLDTQIDTMHKLLEPLIMLFLGLSVGFVIIAMYLPIFQLGSLF